MSEQLEKKGKKRSYDVSFGKAVRAYNLQSSWRGPWMKIFEEKYRLLDEKIEDHEIVDFNKDSLEEVAEKMNKTDEQAAKIWAKEYGKDDSDDTPTCSYTSSDSDTVNEHLSYNEKVAGIQDAKTTEKEKCTEE